MSERRFLIMMNLKKKLVPAVVGAGAALASCVPVFASESAGGKHGFC